MMSSAKGGKFAKLSSCPTSFSLLFYQDLGFTPPESPDLVSHLGWCDFCNAELSLFSAHRPVMYDYEPAEMPAQLRVLAEALLGQNEPHSREELSQSRVSSEEYLVS